MDIKKNVEEIFDIVRKSAEKSGRKFDDIIVLAASKTQPPEKILKAYEAGIKYFGENKVQEGMKKIDQLKEKMPNAHWHLIGGLQTNKAKYAVKYFEMIHSVDRKPLVDELEKRAKKINKTQDILIEVNVGEEETKYGVKPDNLKELVEYTIGKENLNLLGLMCIPPYSENKEDSRKYFIMLREMKEDIENTFKIKLPHLSMGMSNDFDVAIEEGATIVRIGTRIFGERQYR